MVAWLSRSRGWRNSERVFDENSTDSLACVQILRQYLVRPSRDRRGHDQRVPKRKLIPFLKFGGGVDFAWPYRLDLPRGVGSDDRSRL